MEKDNEGKEGDDQVETQAYSVVENEDGTVSVKPQGADADSSDGKEAKAPSEELEILRGLNNETEGDEPPEATSDERLTQQGKDPERTVRNRAERLARRERQRRAANERDGEVRRLQETVAQLTSTVTQLQTGQQRGMVENIGQTIRAYENREAELTDLLSHPDATPAQKAEATKQLVAVAAKKGELLNTKQRAEALLAQGRDPAASQDGRQSGTRQATPDPQVVRLGGEWMAKNAWYRKDRPDADTRVAMALDAQLTEEGWDPRSKDYWDELQERCSVYLRHQFQKGVGSDANGDGSQPGRGDGRSSTSTGPRGPAGNGSGNGRGSGGNGSTFTLSSARVQALKDSGMWDDAKARARGIKRYQEYDAAQRRGGN